MLDSEQELLLYTCKERELRVLSPYYKDVSNSERVFLIYAHQKNGIVNRFRFIKNRIKKKHSLYVGLYDNINQTENIVEQEQTSN